MQNMRSAKHNKRYLSKNLDNKLENNTKDTKKVDKLDKTKNKLETNQEILEERMSHTDLLFGAPNITCPKNDKDDSDEDGDTEG